MLAQQKLQVIALLRQALAGLGVADASVVLERPKVEAHGDVATNVALQIAKGLKRNPRDVATAVVDALMVNPAAAGLIESAEVAGPGFINLRIAPAAKLEVVRQALRERGVRRLPVVRPEGALTGMLALDNLLEALGEEIDGVVGVMRAQRTRELRLRS